MSALAVAKQQKPSVPGLQPIDLSGLPQLPPDPDPKSQTTWKIYQQTAKTLGGICNRLKKNQAEVLALFEPYFDTYLATLEAQAEAREKARKARLEE